MSNGSEPGGFEKTANRLESDDLFDDRDNQSSQEDEDEDEQDSYSDFDDE